LQEVHRFWKTQHLRVVEGRAWKARKVSEGVRVDKLRRDSSFVIPGRRTQEKVRTEEALERKKSSRRRINGQGSQGDSRNPADRQIWEKLRGI
jgi:hypothetical protein